MEKNTTYWKMKSSSSAFVQLFQVSHRVYISASSSSSHLVYRTSSSTTLFSPRWLKIIEKVSKFVRSQNWIGRKFIKNAKNSQFGEFLKMRHFWWFSNTVLSSSYSKLWNQLSFVIFTIYVITKKKVGKKTSSTKRQKRKWAHHKCD